MSDGVCNCSLMSVTNTAGNEGTERKLPEGERPDPVVPITSAGWSSGKAAGSYPANTGSTPVPATNYVMVPVRRDSTPIKWGNPEYDAPWPEPIKAQKIKGFYV